MNFPRNAEIWAVPYLRARVKSLFSGRRTVGRAWVCVTDHYEPMWHNADFTAALERVMSWRAGWPAIAETAPKDSRGARPQYTFFYPEEQYRTELLRPLAEMKRAGIADVEVHIHHDREGREEFIRRMRIFCRILHEQHGLLRERDGRVRFGFIHGNWALDNSLPGGQWCGLNDEIQILRDLGCYADFTMPSGSSPTQARLLNSIYWCIDDPERPKSYDEGTPVVAGGGVEGDLMMITGPFGLRWAERWSPRMEIGELAAGDPPSRYRIRRWFDLAPMIGTDLFVKLHTHGAQERNSRMLLEGGLRDLFTFFADEVSSRNSKFYYVTAWEMFLAIDAIRQRSDPVQAIGAEGANSVISLATTSGPSEAGTTSRSSADNRCIPIAHRDDCE
jgi:hypothetical protein